MKTIRLLPVRGALLVAALVAPFRGHGQSELDSEATVVLPPFVVDEGNTLKWNFVSVDGFEMLTTAKPDVAREFAQNYLLQQRLLDWLIPARFRWHSAEPDRCIIHEVPRSRMQSHELMRDLFGDTEQRERLVAAGADVLPNLQVNEGDSSMIFGLRESFNSLVSHSVGELRRQGYEVTPENIALLTGQSYRFTPERISWLLQHRTPPLPAWLRNGLVALYADAAVGEGSFGVNPLARWGSMAEAERQRTDSSSPRELFPMARLFAGPPDRDTALWVDQCRLFLHWIHTHDSAHYRDALWALAADLETRSMDEDLFRRHFGFGYADARDILSDYLPDSMSLQKSLQEITTAALPEIDVRRATPVEIARLRAEWELLQVAHVRRTQPAVLDLYLNKARAQVASLLQSSDQDPATQLCAGLIEFAAGDTAAAWPYLRNGLALGASRPSAHLAHARIAFDRVTTPELNSEQAGPILAHLQQALRAAPALPEAYQLLAEFWLKSSREPTRAELAQLDQGVLHFPTAPGIVGRIAILHANQGRPKRALAVLDHALRHTPPGSQHDLLQNLRTQLEQTRQASR